MVNIEVYKRWLEAQKYQANTIAAQIHRIGRVENAYGDLDELYELDRLSSVRSSLIYSASDARKGSPNPSKLAAISGDLRNNLASYRNALDRYISFREISSQSVPSVEQEGVLLDGHEVGGDFKRKFSLERDMQAALRQQILQLEVGLQIIDDGVERSVDSGFVDITALDSAGNTVVIELKAGMADRKAVAQIIGYMGDLMHEQENRQVRGILIAESFHANAKSAAMVVPTLSLKTYSINFTFTEDAKEKNGL